MYFVGVDLAWGGRRPTGLAVLDPEGRLVHISACTTDEQIEETVAPYTQGPCVVGFDAPLVVPNASGNRPAEKALNRDFARFDAGAHPSNTGKRELSGVPRAARLAAALGLDIDPASTEPRRAIEVYPHAATIALFRLGRTLKYKARPDRSLAQLRSELLRLMTLLEGLADTTPSLRIAHHATWRALVADVEAASRKSELRRVEDQVDAVVCAYVALYAYALPSRVTTYGDLAGGYIVTPTLPEGHEPAPREARDPARAAVQAYAAMLPDLREATAGWIDHVRTRLDDAGIDYLSVTGRTKTVASFAAKAERVVDGRRLYPDPLGDITDKIGVRVITFVQEDVAAVADLLGDELTILDDRDMGLETASAGRFGYASRHLLVEADDDESTAGTVDPRISEHEASVQVRTVLQHAWAEFEHDIRYKGTIPDADAPDLDRRFTLAAGLLELADREFSAIRERLREDLSVKPSGLEGERRIGAQALASFLGGRYADSRWSRVEQYEWVSGLLVELGITTLDELAGFLASVDTDRITARMGYKHPPGAVRRLDDALLAVFGGRYVELRGNTQRVDLLRDRLELLRRPSATEA